MLNKYNKTLTLIYLFFDTFFFFFFLPLNTSRQRAVVKKQRNNPSFDVSSSVWLQTGKKKNIYKAAPIGREWRAKRHVVWLFARNSPLLSAGERAEGTEEETNRPLRKLPHIVLLKAFCLQFWRCCVMDVATATAENAGTTVKDELAEKCQKLFQAFLEE